MITRNMVHALYVLCLFCAFVNTSNVKALQGLSRPSLVRGVAQDSKACQKKVKAPTTSKTLSNKEDISLSSITKKKYAGIEEADPQMGNLELQLTAGGKPWDGFLILELRQHQQWIAAATTKKGSKVSFDAPPGLYELHIPLADGAPLVIPNIKIENGKLTQQNVNLPLGQLVVEVDAPPFLPQSLPYPNIEVARDDRGGAPWHISESGNPVVFTLPVGVYRVQAGQAASNIQLPPKEVTIKAGEKVRLTLYK